MICKLLVVDPACVIRLSRKKGTFHQLEIYKHGSAQQWLKRGPVQPQGEKSQICPSPLVSKEVVIAPHTVEHTVGPVEPSLTWNFHSFEPNNFPWIISIIHVLYFFFVPLVSQVNRSLTQSNFCFPSDDFLYS